MSILEDLVNKKYMVETVQMALYDDNEIDMLGAPVSTVNGLDTDTFDNALVQKKITLGEIIKIYSEGLHLSISPRSAFVAFTKDVVSILDIYHDSRSFNQRVALKEASGLGITIADLKKFYSDVMSKNGKLVEYTYNKPMKSSFDLGIDTGIDGVVKNDNVLTSKQIIKGTLDNTNSNMGTNFNYRVKGRRKQQ